MANKERKVNIPRSVTDEFYRYKMPDLVAKVEGRGNGIKTVIVNMSDISRALHRPPSYVTKYFGFELGALTTIKEDADRYIVNGNHDKHKLDAVLDSFIKKYVLCNKCELPETNMVFSRGTISMRCAACGNAQQVSAADKIGTFMLKNPPSGAKTETASRTSEKGGKSAHVAAPTVAVTEQPSELPTEATSLLDWSDTSQASVEARRAELIGTNTKAMDLVKITTTVASEEKKQEAVASAVEGLVAGRTPAATTGTALAEAARTLGATNAEIITLAVPLLFGADMRATVIQRCPALLPLVSANSAAQRALLDGITKLTTQHAQLVPVIHHILSGLYDNDVVQEDVILAWHSQLPQDGLRAAAQPFVDWLNTAEEDE
ncbi:Eukaryotic translation initiation factor 5 [Pelomyxa schiedti]|nr:Eukaryotic translation initiation factor 5 [Pelomyxa schiedti]